MPDNTHDPLRLSIVVNNYNYARYLADALDSVIRQLDSQDELIVVDDGSVDESLAILRQYKHEHGITLIQQENQGQMRAVRMGIAAAEGDIVVLLDSDDYFLDGYLDRLRCIYTTHPAVSFVFSNAQMGGDSAAGCRKIRKILDRLELSPGIVGTTKWAALLFHEFVGIPTSGNSLRRELADKVLSFPAAVDDTAAISPLLARVLGISSTEQSKSGLSADGVIVRHASILSALKYYDERPGFMYRIHASNKYATAPGLGRWYLRHRRKLQFRRMIRQRFSEYPTAIELRQEILNRSFGKRLFRRFIVRGYYCRAILVSRGSNRQKLSALAAALGFHSRIA